MRSLLYVFLLLTASLLASTAADLNLTAHTHPGYWVYGSTSTGNIMVSQNFVIPAGDDVHFRATNSIVFKPNFTAVQGSAFTARIVVPIVTNIVISSTRPPPFYPNQSIDFDALTFDQFGDPMSAVITWSLQSGGGSINASTGLYVPPNYPGFVNIQASGGGISVIKTIFIESATAPQAKFVATNSTYPFGFTLDASTSTKQTGRTITQYKWDFGDGTTLVSGTPITTHTFAKGISYNVQLQVMDSAGELSAPLLKWVTVPASSAVYLTAYPTSSGTTVTWQLGYSDKAEPHSIPGVPSVTSRSIWVGVGWRMKYNTATGRYEGFKPDLEYPPQYYIASVRLLAMINNPKIADLFLVSYGLNHNESGQLNVGKGWVEDMGSTPFRLKFTPDKSVAAQTISLIKNTYSYPATGSRNPSLQICGYYIGAPRKDGISVGKGWIDGLWRNSNPLVVANGTENTDTMQSTEAWRGASPYSVWISNWYYLSDTHYLFGYSTVEPSYNVPHSYSGRGYVEGSYVEGSGMKLIFIPSGGG